MATAKYLTGTYMEYGTTCNSTCYENNSTKIVHPTITLSSSEVFGTATDSFCGSSFYGSIPCVSTPTSNKQKEEQIFLNKENKIFLNTIYKNPKPILSVKQADVRIRRKHFTSFFQFVIRNVRKN